MRYTLLIILCIGLIIVSCNQEKKTDQPETEEIISSTECFQHIANNDTVTLSLEINRNSVSGSLLYKFYEKDKNEGTFSGEIKGDTIIADYTFFAEGVTSVSEVVFLKQGNQLIQGFGETMTVDGKQVFKSRSTLDFSDSLVLKSCEKK